MADLAPMDIELERAASKALGVESTHGVLSREGDPYVYAVRSYGDGVVDVVFGKPGESMRKMPDGPAKDSVVAAWKAGDDPLKVSPTVEAYDKERLALEEWGRKAHKDSENAKISAAHDKAKWDADTDNRQAREMEARQSALNEQLKRDGGGIELPEMRSPLVVAIEKAADAGSEAWKARGRKALGKGQEGVDPEPDTDRDEE